MAFSQRMFYTTNLNLYNFYIIYFLRELNPTSEGHFIKHDLIHAIFSTEKSSMTIDLKFLLTRGC